jgi:hypothetical protein
MGKQAKKTKAAAGTPTDTNLFALADLFKAAAEVPNRVRPGDRPHILRCMKAGLVEVDTFVSTLHLTDAGKLALAKRAVEQSKLMVAP